MTNYPVGDFLIKIKNAAMGGSKTIETKNSKFIESVAGALMRAGFLRNVSQVEGILTVSIEYYKKEPRLLGMKLISKPGLRVYKSADDLQAYRGPSTFLISTSKGVLTLAEAKKQRLGGEIIVEVW